MINAIIFSWCFVVRGDWLVFVFTVLCMLLCFRIGGCQREFSEGSSTDRPVFDLQLCTLLSFRRGSCHRKVSLGSSKPRCWSGWVIVEVSLGSWLKYFCVCCMMPTFQNRHFIFCFCSCWILELAWIDSKEADIHRKEKYMNYISIVVLEHPNRGAP
jgi:hypothetical protein